MKNKLIIALVIVLIAVGIIVYVKRVATPPVTAPIIDSTAIGTSTLSHLGNGATASTSATAAGNNPNLVQNATTTASTKEQTAGFIFSCDAEKSINVTLYIGGKDPRADLTLIDNTKNPDGTPNESRRIILKQRAAAATGVKYATDKETIVFTSEGIKAQLVENGRIIFRNCKQTSPEVK